ncbi:MAG: hypothetical protein ABI330_22250 [Caldimonas sp.]
MRPLLCRIRALDAGVQAHDPPHMSAQRVRQALGQRGEELAAAQDALDRER